MFTESQNVPVASNAEGKLFGLLRQQQQQYEDSVRGIGDVSPPDHWPVDQLVP